MSTGSKEMVNIEMLKGVIGKSDKYKHLFALFSQRIRGRSVTTYQSIKKTFKDYGVSFTKDEFTSLCADLETAGAGTIENKGRSKVFRWKWNMKSIADAALSTASVSEIKPQAKTRAKLPRVSDLVVHRKKSAPIRNKVVSFRREKSLEMPERVTIRKNGFEVDVALNGMTDENYNKLSTFFLKLAK